MLSLLSKRSRVECRPVGRLCRMRRVVVVLGATPCARPTVHFEGTVLLMICVADLSTPKMEAVCSFEMTGKYQTTQHHNRDGWIRTDGRTRCVAVRLNVSPRKAIDFAACHSVRVRISVSSALGLGSGVRGR
jgi:hypothetical protein